MNDKGIFLGTEKGKKPVFLPFEETIDNRNVNVIVAGKSGSGMSYYQHHLLKKDEGIVTVIDPQND